MTDDQPDVSEAGFEWCPRCDDWHRPDEHAAPTGDRLAPAEPLIATACGYVDCPHVAEPIVETEHGPEHPTCAQLQRLALIAPHLQHEIDDAEPANHAEDDFNAGYIAGLARAQVIAAGRAEVVS